MVKCKVTRLASALLPEATATAGGGVVETATTATTLVEMDEMGRRVVSQCFHVPFTILDTNECILPMGHSMRHECHSSTICVNTIGSYECLCPRLGGDNKDENSSLSSTVDNGEFWTQVEQQPRSPWEVSFNTTSRTTCPSRPSTRGCCPERVHTKDGSWCRKAFRCPMDPCGSSSSNNGNDCTSVSTCARKEFPVEEPNYICQCPPGLMGNGHKCKPGIDPKPKPEVMFDGVTPTEETIKNNYYCGCTAPVVDACSGFPPCKGLKSANHTPERKSEVGVPQICPFCSSFFSQVNTRFVQCRHKINPFALARHIMSCMKSMDAWTKVHQS
jgi:hypothetical protein